MSKTNEFKWWTNGDLDGFFGLFIDNIIQLILIVVLCKFAVGLPDELVIERILPGVAVSLLIGNIFYAIQAKKLALKTGKMVTALPYGINTVSLFAYVLFVMKPVMDQSGDADLAWKVGIVACFASGVIELGGAFVVGWIKKVTPRAALLATLAGIAITFISMDFCFRIFADPIVGLVPLAFIFMQYIGRAYLPANIPAGLVAVIIGTALAWSLGRMDGAALSAAADISLQPPIPYIGDLFGMLTSKYLIEYLPVIIPMGLFNLLGSMQNLESAEAAGDRYEVKSSLAANGIGTIAASIFGSTFPTTIYRSSRLEKDGRRGWLFRTERRSNHANLFFRPCGLYYRSRSC